MRHQKLMAFAPYSQCAVLAAQSALGLDSFINLRGALKINKNPLLSARGFKFISNKLIHKDPTHYIANHSQGFSNILKKEDHHHHQQQQQQQQPIRIPVGFGAEEKTECKIRQERLRQFETQQEMTFSKLQEMEDKISRMATKLEALTHVNEVQMKLNRVNLSYTSGELVTVPRNPSFRNTLLEAYGYKRSMKPGGKVKLLRCPVIDHPVPASNLIAAHIFKHEWGTVANSVLGIDSIDSPENGMMLFSPIEFCFDMLQLCFICSPHNDEADDDSSSVLTCHVLDPDLMSKTLISVAKKRGNWKGKDDKVLRSLTFADIDGRRLSFMTSHRPLREALNFHARQARLHAISKGWIDESWDFQDFFTDQTRWKRIRIWVDQSIHP